MSAIKVRTLAEDQWPEWRALRLAALATDPDAFGSTLAEWSGPGDVEVRSANQAALALYRRHGLADVGPASAPNDPHPERRMALELA